MIEAGLVGPTFFRVRNSLLESEPGDLAKNLMIVRLVGQHVSHNERNFLQPAVSRHHPCHAECLNRCI